MKTKVKIVEIGEHRRFRGIIYAKLVEVEGGALCIAATLEYIFNALRERPEYDCVNVSKNKWGDYTVVM